MCVLFKVQTGRIHTHMEINGAGGSRKAEKTGPLEPRTASAEAGVQGPSGGIMGHGPGCPSQTNGCGSTVRTSRSELGRPPLPRVLWEMRGLSIMQKCVFRGLSFNRDPRKGGTLKVGGRYRTHRRSTPLPYAWLRGPGTLHVPGGGGGGGQGEACQPPDARRRVTRDRASASSTLASSLPRAERRG